MKYKFSSKINKTSFIDTLINIYFMNNLFKKKKSTINHIHNYTKKDALQFK